MKNVVSLSKKKKKTKVNKAEINVLPEGMIPRRMGTPKKGRRGRPARGILARKLSLSANLTGAYADQFEEISQRKKLGKSDTLRYLLNVENEYRKFSTPEGRELLLAEVAAKIQSVEEESDDDDYDDDDEYEYDDEYEDEEEEEEEEEEVGEDEYEEEE
tara:strand:+ start:11042 stop:11518 length:477 start_codon:yes stop_codon:yes gene_type:complete